MKFINSVIFGGLFFACHASFAAADQVTLTDPNGGLSISGDVTGYDGEFLNLKTETGPLSVRLGALSCAGAGCPETEMRTEVMLFQAPREITSGLLLDTFLSFADTHDYKVVFGRDSFGVINISYETQEFENISEIKISATGTSTLAEAEKQVVVQYGLENSSETRTASLSEDQSDLISAPRRVFAYDALVPVVGEDNGVDDILLADLLRILSGEITDWSELGGAPSPITVILPKHNQAAFQAVLGKDALISPQIVRITDGDASSVVAGVKGSLGFVPFHQDPRGKILPIRDECGATALPTRFSIHSGEYPLSFPYVLKLPTERPNPIMRKMLRFLHENLAQTTVSGTGFVSLGPKTLSVEAQGTRLTRSLVSTEPDVTLEDLRNLARILTEADRLSTTFIIAEKGPGQWEKTQSDAEALINHLQSRDYADKKIVLLGFSDSTGEPAANIELSQTRAETYRELLESLATDRGLLLPPIEAIGLGEAAPIGCNLTRDGQALNRRVEVWVKDR